MNRSTPASRAFPRPTASVSARIFAVLLGVTFAACGGGSASSKGNNTLAPGQIRRPQKPTVNRRAQAFWLRAMTSFEDNEKAKWTGSACAKTSEAFERAIEAQKDKFPQALYMLGLVKDRCGDESGAQSLFKKALDQDPSLCGARSALGTRALERGRTKEARQLFEQAIAADAQCVEAYVNLATIQRGNGSREARAALQNIRRAMAVDARFLPAFNQLALLYLDQAVGDKKQQFLDLANVVCRQAQLIDDRFAPIYNTWGLIQLAKDDLIEAVRMFEQATKLDDSMFEAFMNFGLIALSFRGYDDAKKAIERALALRPKSYEARVAHGAVLRALRKTDAAEKEYLAAKDLNGNRPEAYFDLGLLFQDYKSGSVNDLKVARDYYNEFLRRARGKKEYKNAVEAVSRRCKNKQKRRRRSKACRPGRLQNIDRTIEILKSAGA